MSAVAIGGRVRIVAPEGKAWHARFNGREGPVLELDRKMAFVDVGPRRWFPLEYLEVLS